MKRYFEFNQNKYYALICAEDIEHALQLYKYFVHGSTISDIKKDGLPQEVTRDYALDRYLRKITLDGEYTTFEDVRNKFESIKYGVALED